MAGVDDPYLWLEDITGDDALAWVRRRGEWLYNFWRDAANPRGLWRRTTLDSYRTDAPEWEVVIDLDALAADEDENWVWAGANVIEPDHSLALITLSRGARGQDPDQLGRRENRTDRHGLGRGLADRVGLSAAGETLAKGHPARR